MPQYNAKTLNYKSAGAGAINYGVTANNWIPRLEKLWGQRTNPAGGSKTFYDKIYNWASPAAITARGGNPNDTQWQYFQDYFRTGKINPAMRPRLGATALDLGYRENARQQQTKETFFDTVFGKILKFGAPIAAGMFLPGLIPGLTAGWAGAGAGAAAGGAASAGGQAASAATKGGGFFSNLFKGAKGLMGKLNPLTAIKGAVKSAGGIGGFLKTTLKKIPLLNTLLTGFFAYNDIKSLIENPIGEDGQPLSKDKLSEEVGKIVAGGLGGILGGAMGTAVGGPLGTIVGSMGGEWLFKNLLGLFPEAAAGLGEAIIPMFGTEKKMAKGGIVTGPTRALVGEAGNEAVIPLDKFYAKLDELISVVKA